MTSFTTSAAQPTTPSVAAGSGGDLFRGLNSLSNRVSPVPSSHVHKTETSLNLLSCACAYQLTDRLKEGGLAGGFDNLISGVKNFLPAHKDYTVSRLVEAIMEPSAASAQAIQDTDDYLLFDARQPRNRSAAAGGRSAAGAGAGGGGGGGRSNTGRLAFSEAVVFVAGGGSCLEFANLQDFAARSSPSAGGPGYGAGQGRKITYGSTEILSPSQFLGALGTLHRRGA
jgi:hypothetical protein